MRGRKRGTGRGRRRGRAADPSLSAEPDVRLDLMTGDHDLS